MKATTKKQKMPIFNEKLPNSYADKVRGIAENILLNGLESDAIGATAEHITKIAILRAKKIVSCLNHLENMSDDDLLS
jgi:hypothetical protein